MINDIYESKVKLPAHYFTKHTKLPPFPGTGRFGGWTGWEGHDYPRTRCILDFMEWTPSISGEHLAYTCNSDPELEFIYDKFKKRTELSYPEYDLHNLPKELNNTFDFFLFNQTLEHLHHPFLAMQNINKILKTGGWVFTSVPTINIPHMTPSHFSGFTPMGLALLFMHSGFEVIKLGQWGNYNYLSKLFLNHSWPDVNELKDSNGEVPNEEKNCCQCWVLAKKI
jgi:SAM-dependent methyltransferase